MKFWLCYFGSSICKRDSMIYWLDGRIYISRKTWELYTKPGIWDDKNLQN